MYVQNQILHHPLQQTELIVKRAGVKMDGANHADAEKLFAKALQLNSTAPDALLHRANLRMLQQRAAEAESDLETCIRLYPNNLLARLRLATVFMAKEDISGANRMLDQAAEYDPDSSEVHCYRGGENNEKNDILLPCITIIFTTHNPTTYDPL